MNKKKPPSDFLGGPTLMGLGFVCIAAGYIGGQIPGAILATLLLILLTLGGISLKLSQLLWVNGFEDAQPPQIISPEKQPKSLDK